MYRHTRGRIPPRVSRLFRGNGMLPLIDALKVAARLVRDRLEREGIASGPVRLRTELPVIGRVPNSSASQAVSSGRSSFTESSGPHDHAETELLLHRQRTKRRDQTANAVQARKLNEPRLRASPRMYDIGQVKAGT